jgi:alanine racemase
MTICQSGHSEVNVGNHPQDDTPNGLDEAFWDGPPQTEACATLTIDLGALVANWRLLRTKTGTACAAVVKADAYGIGLEHAVRALSTAGCDTFFVAHLSEAIRVREVDTEATVYVLNGLPPGTAATYAGLHVRPVLGAAEEIAEWAGFCRSNGIKLPAALHVDTGMNRLGLSLDEAKALGSHQDVTAFTPALLMTHFVSSEVPNDPINARQIAAFSAIQALFPGVAASACNSSGIFLPGNRNFDLVRGGYALYGGNPTPERDNPMQPVVRLEARIIQIRHVSDGTSVGYNAQWTARGARRLVTIGVGYADGYPRSASATDIKRDNDQSVGMALIGGVACPFAGRVSMDLIIIDATDAPDAAVRRGAPVTLIGDALDIDTVALCAGTIGYEILTSLGRRYARRYIGAA